MNKLKKILKIVGLVAALVVVAFIAYGFYVMWAMKTGNLVQANGRWYNKAEWNQYLESLKVGPQYVEVAAVNTPEEVYAKFREALLKNDIEAALNEMRPQKRDAYREALKDKGKLEKLITTMPEKVENLKIDGNDAVYNWDKKDGYSHGIYFRKDLKGNWQIDTI